MNYYINSSGVAISETSTDEIIKCVYAFPGVPLLPWERIEKAKIVLGAKKMLSSEEIRQIPKFAEIYVAGYADIPLFEKFRDHNNVTFENAVLSEIKEYPRPVMIDTLIIDELVQPNAIFKYFILRDITPKPNLVINVRFAHIKLHWQGHCFPTENIINIGGVNYSEEMYNKYGSAIDALAKKIDLGRHGSSS